MKRRLLLAISGLLLLSGSALSREIADFNDGWLFTFGDASSPAADFGCGTEYFNYLTKAASIHNEGPYSPKFNTDSCGRQWVAVTLPHDWVVDLPYSPDASHSHGYKTVGHRYPQTSVGWYRKTFHIPPEDLGKHIWLEFDGIFRDSRLWVNGFYLGGEPDGYASAVYDISEYLDYGGENVIAVRVDASLEEGWFYEGAGIYRNARLTKSDKVHVAPWGTFITTTFPDGYDSAVVNIETRTVNSGNSPCPYSLRHTLLDRDGNEVASVDTTGKRLLGKEEHTTEAFFTVDGPHLWSVDEPYLYKVRTEVLCDDNVIDTYTTSIGIRDIAFDADNGFLLNGKALKLKGVNLHQDHASVGAAIPDALQAWRLRELKKYGVNAYRSSHNPMSPAMLDACDSIGVLVIDENRLTGVNREHQRLLENMIVRDRNHPSVIMWSVGNEEWGIEWNEKGERIAESMREYVHRLDSTRPMTAASSSGPTILVPTDVAGYNYIMQNPVEQHRRDYPQRCAYGSEETTGCGTRGVYYDDGCGHMAALNRSPNGSDSILNCIERGWKFYDERPWLSGLFYWTGFDYRGEPNPLAYPATGSQFGLLDYAGFPKDEMMYLKAWWTDEPVLHILPHWNLAGHEGEKVSIWAYSNCEEVELSVNGKSLGRKTMPRNGHLEWEAVYQPGTGEAVGFRTGKKVATTTVSTADPVAKMALNADRNIIAADGKDVTVVAVELQDERGRFAPQACDTLTIAVEGPLRILGAGNGDSALRIAERPAKPMTIPVCEAYSTAVLGNDRPYADGKLTVGIFDPDASTFSFPVFNGRAAILIQSTGDAGTGTVSIGSPATGTAMVTITAK